MIPDLVDLNGIWNVLPPGIHDATMEDVKVRFAINAKRELLYTGFEEGVLSLKRAGCKTVYLDGSFVTEKPNPADFDACWVPEGVEPEELDSELLQFGNGREAQKLKYGGEFFFSTESADGTRTFKEYFQIDRYTGKEKGIIRIQIS